MCNKQHSEQQRNNNVAMMTTTATKRNAHTIVYSVAGEKKTVAFQIKLPSWSFKSCLSHQKDVDYYVRARTHSSAHTFERQCHGFALQQSVQHQGNTSINRQNTVEPFRNVLRVCGKQECSLKSAKFDATISAQLVEKKEQEKWQGPNGRRKSNMQDAASVFFSSFICFWIYIFSSLQFFQQCGEWPVIHFIERRHKRFSPNQNSQTTRNKPCENKTQAIQRTIFGDFYSFVSFLSSAELRWLSSSESSIF